MSLRASLVAAILAAAVVPSLSYAQNNNGGGDGGGRRNRDNNNGNNNNGNNNGGGNGGQRGNWDPAEMQRRMMENLKERLAPTDDEWKVIEPKLAKVMEAQRSAYSGMGGGFGRGGRGGGGGGGGGGDQQPTTKMGIAAKALRDATQSDASSPEDLSKKLEAYRAAKAEASATLETSRKDLKEVLTAKQEAVLVLNGTLE